MEAAQTSALALYFGLDLLLIFLLALNVVQHHFKADPADQIMISESVRAHGNNIECVPIILIGLGVMAITGALAQTISIRVGALLAAHVPRTYGIQQTKMRNLFFGMVGNIVTWFVMLCAATTLVLQGISQVSQALLASDAKQWQKIIGRRS